MMTLHAFCESTPGKWLTQPYARKLAQQGRIGYWDLDRKVFVPACIKLGPRAWIITCDHPVIKPAKYELRRLNLPYDTLHSTK